MTGQSWNSDAFSFRRGVFQGDPWSPILFLAVFNPIVQYLKSQEESFGYKLEGMPIITLPFADDFSLITSNKRTHQRLINSIHVKTESMNLSLKPSKCRSISICQGKPKEIPFKIGETPLLSVKDEPEKFLGMYITYHGKTSEIYQIIHDKLKSALENIENSLVRGEYKIRVFTEYTLPSFRYFLTVHSLTDTQLDNLDSLETKFLKSWLKMPKTGATQAIIFSNSGLKIKRISEVYFESHTLSYASTMLRGDSKVKHALETRIDRESQWTQKMKNNGTKKSKEIINVAVQNNVKCENWNIIKTSVKAAITESKNQYWKDYIEPLVKQGNLLKLIELENNDLTWRSIMYNLPRGVLSFAVRASIDCLPTPDNLLLWGKKTNDKCKLCGGKGTLLHLLNWCPVALQQGRFTYRHNSILSCIVRRLQFGAESNNIHIKLYADLSGLTINGGTIPASIIPTSEKPDICIYIPDDNKVILVELTVPFETNFDKARQRKCERYEKIIRDINDAGYQCTLICIEIGSRGVITKENKKQLKKLQSLVRLKQTDFYKQLSKISLICSYAIYNARYEPAWTDMSLLK